MRVICISDTHTRHREVEVPEGDILLHAGDITYFGEDESLDDFNDWVGGLPHPHKILIAGNHDRCFEDRRYKSIQRLSNIIYLEDASVTIEGLKIYGSPWQPYFHNWAFNLKTPEELRAVWETIPEDIDILITHTPPYGILDQLASGASAGCGELAKVLEHFPQLRLHLFGHIHRAAGVQESGARVSVNASVCDEHYNVINQPVVVDI